DLVQHRSGIPNYTDQPGFLWDDPPKNSNESLELVLDMPADFEPDEKYSYSNTNYLLIRKILDKVLGYNYHQYIKEEILIPLELNNTFSSLHEVDIDDVMSGYYVGVESDFKHIDFGMMATAEDVGIFLRALNDGSLLNDNEQAIYSSVVHRIHIPTLLVYGGKDLMAPVEVGKFIYNEIETNEEDKTLLVLEQSRHGAEDKDIENLQREIIEFIEKYR
ncbi:MAG: beta-lactamase family protein, partial [Chloroflexi bacterium]|nr:beta-lactamase family protein [Chloroflexota bacterium]